MSTQKLFNRFGRTFPAGTVLFSEGDPGGEMYVIHRGMVRISRQVGQRQAVLAMLPAGEFFGEMAILNNRPRSATATVEEEADLIIIDARVFEVMIRANMEIGVRMIKRLSLRLARANSMIDVLLYRGPDHRVVRYLRHEAEARGEPRPSGILVPISDQELVDQLGLSPGEVRHVLSRLVSTGLLAQEQEGMVIRDIQSLLEFLEYLEINELLESSPG